MRCAPPRRRGDLRVRSSARKRRAPSSTIIPAPGGERTRQGRGDLRPLLPSLRLLPLPATATRTRWWRRARGPPLTAFAVGALHDEEPMTTATSAKNAPLFASVAAEARGARCARSRPLAARRGWPRARDQEHDGHALAEPAAGLVVLAVRRGAARQQEQQRAAPEHEGEERERREGARHDERDDQGPFTRSLRFRRWTVSVMLLARMAAA